MILYSIRRKSDGKRFVGFRGYDNKAIWNDKGSLFRTITPIIRHLSWLSTKDDYKKLARFKIGNYWFYMSYEALWRRNVRPKIKNKLLKQYEVVIHDVAIMGIKRIPAKKYFEGRKN